ncbi:MAG: FAD-dependent oxidoreductase [Gemmatimonadetes bacterium]|nr:FAD-dependent oxidoreductase [Gemmatimonadota bacterium]
MTRPGTRTAIVGAGPAGFFTAEALLKGGTAVAVDIINSLPTPFGLVRDGVAPDHQAIKSVARVYQKILARDEVRYFGNVTLGRDVTVDELRSRYDQIVYAVGAQSDRRLNIPGEDLEGSHPALRFVAWYNGHPGFRDAEFDLGCEDVVVIGNGNVAIDVARILVLSLDRLATTDIADHALEALRKSRVKRVTLLGRRGPVQASFTNPELREFGRLDGVCAEVDASELETDAASLAALEGNAVKTRNMNTLRGYAGVGADGARDGDRVVRFRFLVSPLEVVGEGGRVTGVRIERNRLVEQADGYMRAMGTGETETLPCGMMIRSVGYRGAPVPGVPFDEARGIVPNEGGRVLAAAGSAETVPGEYVVGWAKRGPSGVIGTNKADAAGTVALMGEDREGGVFAGGRRVGGGGAGTGGDEGLPALLRERGVHWVDNEGWERLDAHETARGKVQGRPRVKLCSIAEMLEAARGPATVA